MIDSAVGYAVGQITGGTSPHSDSPIGWVTGTIGGPPPAHVDSPIGYASGTIKGVHLPVTILTSTGLRHTAPLVWDGTRLR